MLMHQRIPWTPTLRARALFLLLGAMIATLGLRLTREQEFDGADLSIHRISATPDRDARR